MRKLASDIEAVGFYRSVKTKQDIHCLCSVDVDTGEVFLFHNHPELDGVKVWDSFDNIEYTIPPRIGTLDEGVSFWEKESSEGSLLIIHNCFGYDKLVVDKIWGDNKIKWESYWDTYVQSKVQWFERPTPKGAKGPHGLQAYGVRCGINKPEVTDWSTMDAYKLHRVVEDCRIQAKTYIMLEKERESLKTKLGIDFTQALKIESKYAYLCSMQEIRGTYVDVEHIKACIEDLDSKISKLEEEITPLLPPTVKGKGQKVSRKEVAELLGYDPSKVKEHYVSKVVDGVPQAVVDKPYVKPTVNFTKEVKGKFYKGFHISYGETKQFKKKKDLQEFIKNTYPLTKFKEWEVEVTESSTTVLNKVTCDYFGIDEDSDLIAGPFTKVEILPSSMTQSEVVKGFLIRLGWKEAEDWNIKKDSEGGYVKADKDTEVRWPPKAAPENQMVKLVKKGGLMVTTPKLSDGDYSQLPEGVGKKIAEYNTYQHRRRFLSNPKDPENKGILSFVDENDRIPCGVNNFGTRTGRGAQRVWVNAPSVSALYGEEIRRSIKAPEGKVLVGVDMKSAQLSIAAYYANNYEYYNNVATGVEFDSEGNYVGLTAHCVNARMFGMVSEEEYQTAVATQDEELIHKISIIRKNSKGGSFATIFGASGKKVGKTIGIPEKDGVAKKDMFLKQMGLDNTIACLEKLGNFNKRSGGWYLPMAFGYWLWNNSTHKNLNTVVQGFEALAQKLCCIKFNSEVEKMGVQDHVMQVLDTHDEFLLECTEGYEKLGGELLGKCYTWASEQIYRYHLKNPKEFPNIEPPKFSIDLNGGYKVGVNYYEVH